MRKILFLTVFMLFSIILLYPAKAKIFFVNLYSEKADVRLGEEKSYIFKMDELEPFTSTIINVTDKIGSYKLYFKTSAEKKWYFWSDDAKKAKICDVKDGDVLCILFGYEGSIHYFVLKEPKGSGALVCMLNGSDESLPKMAVSKSWEEESNIYIEDIDSNIITNFGLLKPGPYGLFWQFEEQVEDERYFFYPDDKGEVEMISFKSGKYYLFLAYVDDGTKYAVCYNISPN